MNDEVKEYLDKSNYKFKDVDENGNEVEMSLSEMIQSLLDTNERLGDYITNLQEENESLKELCNKYEEEHNTTFKIWKKDLKNFEHEKNRELKSRIDKAIEFIEEELTFYITIGGTDERKLIGYNKAFDELLNILEGKK